MNNEIKREMKTVKPEWIEEQHIDIEHKLDKNKNKAYYPGQQWA